MNSTRAWPALVATLLLTASFGSLRAGDWKTSDGKVYEDVKLIRLDSDTVTILHKDGRAQIPLEKLSPDLQKRFGYDPDTAKAAADARAKEAALNAKELQAEMDKASEMHQAGREPAPATDADATSPETADDATGPIRPGENNGPAASATVSGDGSHHFMDEIANSAAGSKPAAADASHHSIDDATQTATAMRRDLTDPTYHTMAHMFYTVRQDGLRADATDTTHHTIDETTQAASEQK